MWMLHCGVTSQSQTLTGLLTAALGGWVPLFEPVDQLEGYCEWCNTSNKLLCSKVRTQSLTHCRWSVSLSQGLVHRQQQSHRLGGSSNPKLVCVCVWNHMKAGWRQTATWTFGTFSEFDLTWFRNENWRLGCLPSGGVVVCPRKAFLFFSPRGRNWI